MKPYIGILIDSFWEATNSKVLWALLICWSLLLIALAPFGYIAEESFEVSGADISDRSRLIDKLAENARGRGKDNGKQVAKLLDEKFVKKLKRAAAKDSDVRIRAAELGEELNKLMSSTELYDKDIFPTVEKREDLEELTIRPTSELDKQELTKLNRHLLWLTYPLAITRPRGEVLWFGYGGLKISNPLPLSRKQLGDFIEPMALQLIIKIGLGVLVVFIAVIVTSSIIPETFRSGSLHLLLSKPIARVGLYLSKFLGGAVFVLVNLTFVLVGLYLIAGFRFQIWNEGLLWCIPILLFVFLIFYSVSGLAGLIWGNAIVCVVSCMIFWFGCWLVSSTRGFCYQPAEFGPQVNEIKPINEHLTTVTQSGDLKVWNEEFSVWQPAVKSMRFGDQYRMFGPIHDKVGNRVLLKKFAEVPFRGPYAPTREMQVIQLPGAGQTKDPLVELEDDEPESKKSESESKQMHASDTTKLDAPAEASQNKSEDSATDSVKLGDTVDPELDPIFDALDALGSQNGGLSSMSTDLEEDPEQRVSKDVEKEVEDKKTDEQSSSEQDAESESDSTDDGDLDEFRDEEDELDSSDTKEQPKDAGEARRMYAWEADVGPALPQQLFRVLEVEGRVIAVCRGGLYELDMSRIDAAKTLKSSRGGFFGLDQLVDKSAFKNLAPSGYFLSENSNASVLSDKSGLVIFNSGDVDVLKFQADRLELTQEAQTQFEDADPTVPALVRMSNKFCVIARDELPIQILDAELNDIGKVELPSGENIKKLEWIPGSDELAVITHAGQLFSLDCEEQKLEKIRVPVRGPFSAMLWESQDVLWLAKQPNSIYKIDLNSNKKLKQWIPEKSGFEKFYFWGVMPAYEIFPKPAALDDAMTFVLVNKKTQGMSVVNSNLESTRRTLDIWSPIWSNLGFLAFMLTISCIYVARKEF